MIFRSTIACGVALATLASALFAVGGTAQAQQLVAGESHTGFLTVEWSDPHRSSTAGSDTKFHIVYPNGTEVPLDFGAADLRNVAVQHAGKIVTISGRASAAVSGKPGITVESIESAEPANSAAAKPRARETKKALFVLLRFKGDKQKPHAPSFYKQLTEGPLQPDMMATINGFFKRTSWDQIKFKATVVGQQHGTNPTTWMTLPHDREYYAPCDANGSCFDSFKLRQDALPMIAARGVDIEDFDTINFVVNNDLGCCASGGSFSNGSRSWDVTYEPPWAQEPTTYIHELGHSIGLPHSGWVYYAYDNPWDDMGTNQIAADSATCGTYDSANFGGPGTSITCYEPGAGYLAGYKDRMGWIPSANKVVIKRSKPVTNKLIDLSANATSLGSTKKLIIVCYHGYPCSGSKARYMTIEAKLSVARYEQGLLHDGVIISDMWMERPAVSGNCFFNNQSGWAQPRDRTKGDYDKSTCSYGGGGTLATAALGNAHFRPGDIYDDKSRKIKVRVMKSINKGFQVRITTR